MALADVMETQFWSFSPEQQRSALRTLCESLDELIGDRKQSRAALAAAVAEREALVAAGEMMADCIGYFWKPSPCEHSGDQCGPCEVERWGLLYESMQRWRALGVTSGGEDA